MRSQLVAVAAALLVANSCGDDRRVLDPDFGYVDIVLTLDWPMAREDGFVATRWSALSVYPDFLIEGEFDANGLALIEFTDTCTLGEPLLVWINYEGHYTAAQPGTEECYGGIYKSDHVLCTASPQTFVAPRPEGPGCQRPDS
jgi:hypothetical protein